MCSCSVFPSSLWVQWSPHPGPGFPTFAGIFEFAIRYFALERCFPLLAGTLFILLSLEVPRYHRHAFGSSTNGDNPVPAFQESPACPPPTRSVPAPTIASLGFLLSHHANIERIPPIRTECGRGWLQPAELSISSQTHGITAHVNVPETGPAFGTIFLSGSNDLTDPGIEPGICGFEPRRPNRSATRSSCFSGFWKIQKFRAFRAWH